MKKIFPILFAIPTLLLASCHAGEIDKSKIALDYGHIRDTEVANIYQFDDLDYDNLDALLLTKESFVLLTYHNKECGCWKDFAPLAVQFANEYHYDFRILDVALLSGHSEKFDIYSGRDAMPGIVFIRRGKVIRQTIYGKLNENNRKMFKKYKDFKEYMLKGIYLPSMYYIEKKSLDAKLDNNDTLNLYVAKKTCDDCNYVNKHFLYDWSSKNHTVDNPLYIFDIEVYQSDKYPEGYYQQMKDRYGLSTANNPTFGYDTEYFQGFVPTFQRRRGWTILDMLTVLNDSVEKVGDDYIIHSYFTEARVNNSPILAESGSKYVLEGKVASKDVLEEREYEGHTYVTFSREGQYKMHKEAIKLFFDNYGK